MQFAGASPLAQIHGDQELPGKINRFIGNDPAQWRCGLPTFAQVRVEGIYPGINLVYYGNQRQIEYDLTVAAGADPDLIALRFDGADQNRHQRARRTGFETGQSQNCPAEAIGLSNDRRQTDRSRRRL